MRLDRLKDICDRRKGGMRLLAFQIGMSEANLYRCVKENKMQAPVLERIARLLDVSVCEFFDESAVKTKREMMTEEAAAALQRQLAAKDSQIAEKDRQIAEKDRQIAGLLAIAASSLKTDGNVPQEESL